MEQKRVLFSALSLGVGLGVGLGLSVQKWFGGYIESDEISEEQIVHELENLLNDVKDYTCTFDEFPYYLSDKTRVLLTSAGNIYLKQDFNKHMRNLSPPSRAILLSGHAELYHHMLSVALAHNFQSKLMLLDITDFSLEMQRKYGCSRKEPYFKMSISEVNLERMSGSFGSSSILPSTGETRGTLSRQSSRIENSNNPPKLRRNASPASNMSSNSQHGQSDPPPLNCTSRICFDEKLFMQSLYKVLVSVSETGSIILYIKEVDKLFVRLPRMYHLLQKLIKKLSGTVLILGSRVINSEDDCKEVDEKLTLLFPYNIEIIPPEDETHLGNWKALLEEDKKRFLFQYTKNHIAEVLAANDIDCDELNTIFLSDTMLLSNYIEEIVLSAITYHLMSTGYQEYRYGKLVISAQSLAHVLRLFQEGNSSGTDIMKPNESNKNAAGEYIASAKKDVPATKRFREHNAPAKKAEFPLDNEFEKCIRPEVIAANEIVVTFADIGALDDIKESLEEVVMLPLRRPDLFKGGLLKPCKGLLLFGPPGTGKTMLAKAIANESGASFISISMSTITAKWFGGAEKNVRALFTVAAKVAPTIIFIDEVDSMLGQRTRAGENEAMRSITNEFMIHWDGLLTKPGEQILVLAATNRPFDLDEAIIRRFEHRIMVGLPSTENREMILKTLLAKEKHENIDFKELSTMTQGYSGSDLKNLCSTAAYRPVRELIQQERLKEMEKKKKEAKVQSSEDASNATKSKEDKVITLRPINMEDMRQATNQVAASFDAEGSTMKELKQWNDLYGQGGSRENQHLDYFF
ncbi:uncharacterized protein LOC133290581 [Gastrolobium bilobum]|uniref:uncharacterized protein LOC133290581 n=1 Tax=Gastrolobium bilobum TaxID=150636 RepID=UPI002AAF27AB|nr:uncharacterized protein LOC133290581 [Gastrolobium bilobum]